MINIRVDFDARALQRRVEGLRREVVEKITVSALNRAIATVKTAAGREIRRELVLPAKSVRARLRVQPATAQSLEALIRAKDYDPALSRMKPKWRRRQPGGAVIQLPQKGRLTVLGAFMGATKYGGQGVYRRTGVQRNEKRGTRKFDENIKFLRASDVGLPTFKGVVMQSSVNRQLLKIGRDKFNAEVVRLMRRRVSVGRRVTSSGTVIETLNVE